MGGGDTKGNLSMGGGDTTTTVEDESENIAAVVKRLPSTSDVPTALNSPFKSASSPPLDHSSPSFPSRQISPPEKQRLIYKGRILKEDQTLKSYGLEADHTVHLVRGFAAAASASATNAVNPNTSTGGGAFVGAGVAPLFPGLGSGGGPFGAELPDFEQVQQQLTQNPDVVREMMNMPLVQNIINNREIIRNLVMNNPQMREIMDRNPELAHVFNDPATLCQTMDAARNPELMREMMRSTDRAMSNIESSPEGFNMLRRMYENVQEPFLNATAMAGDTRNDSGTNPFTALLGAQGHRRNQSTNLPATGSDTNANPPFPNINPLPNPWASAGTGGTQMNTTARSNTAGDSRAPPLGGLGALPDLQRMLGGMPDASSVN